MKYHPNIDNRSLSEFSMLCKEDGFYGDFENSRENWPTCLQDVECDIPPEIPTNSEYVLKKVCKYYWFVLTECTVSPFLFELLFLTGWWLGAHQILWLSFAIITSVEEPYFRTFQYNLQQKLQCRINVRFLIAFCLAYDF